MEDQPSETSAARPSWTVRVLGATLGAMLTLGSLLWAADIYRKIGLDEMFNEQFYGAMLAISLALVFIVMPARRKTPRLFVPWYDVLAAIVGAGAAIYVALYYPNIMDNLADNPTDGMIVSTIIIALVAEGLRRTAGKVLFFFLIGFICFGLLGHLIPGEFQGEEVAIEEMVVYLGMDTNGLLGIAMRVSTTIVISFVFFGTMLAPAGGGAFFTDLSTALMGRYRGGSSKIAVVASSLFGSISGSAVSNVVSTGVITIPMMRDGGYPAHSAAAIEAVASTGGQLMPPMMGAAAFVMAELLETEYTEVVLAALIPALLYYVALFIQTDLQAARDGISRVEESLIPRAWPVLRSGWPFIIPFAVIILALFYWHLQPETAALYAALTLVPIGLFLGYKGRRMKLVQIWTTLSSTGINVVEIMMIGAAAGMIMGVLNITGLGFGLSLALVKFAQGNLFVLLILAALVCIVLGMGMPTLGVYLLVALLVAPSIIELGVPTMSAHLFVLYYGMMSMITPPVAIAAFAAASVAGAEAMRTGWAAVGFGWSAYVVPFLFVLSPELIMQGDPGPVALAVVTAVGGVWLVSIGVVGYLVRPLDPLYRGLFGVAGLALLLPASAFSGAIWTDLFGVALAALLLTREYTQRRRVSAAE